MTQTTPPPPVRDKEVSEQEGSQSAGSVVGLNLARIAAALVVPLVGMTALYLSFEWIRDTEANKAAVVVIALLVGVVGIFFLYWAMDLVVNQLPVALQESLRPWVFVGPAIVVLSVFLVYPAVNTLILSLKDATGDSFVGLENYGFVFTDDGMLRALRNTLGWIIIVPLFSVGVGLAFAVLADKLRRGEATVKALIFLPMAISFVGASIVWRFIYNFRPEGFGEQIGLANGIWTAFGAEPVAWLAQQPWNNFMLMVIMIWLQTGFAMVILSAAIKGVSEAILEAARIDGANEWQVFRQVVLPSILSSVVVVTTTTLISVLKVFDIVFVMTNGESGTEVIAEQMIRWFFRNGHDGRGAAIAVVLLIAIIPVMYINVRRFRAEEALR